MKDPLRPLATALDDDDGIISAPIAIAKGALLTEARDGVITARRVSLPRDEEDILRKLSIRAKAFAHRYVYSWAVKDKKGGTKRVRGPSIDLALTVAKLYGNCDIRVFEEDHGDHWTFHARFVDVETGFQLTRPFHQRKDQNLGMADIGRATDIVYQIGVSKALRNVIVGSLREFVDYAMEEADGRILEWATADPARAIAFVRKTIDEENLSLNRIESTVGRTISKWLASDIARVCVELKSIQENMASADDLYPLKKSRSANDNPLAAANDDQPPQPAAEAPTKRRGRPPKNQTQDEGGAADDMPESNNVDWPDTPTDDDDITF